MRVQPVILCGGSGTRLWPISGGLGQSNSFLFLVAVVYCNIVFYEFRPPHQEIFFQKHGYELSEKPICIGSEYHKFQILDEAEQAGIEIDCVFEPLPKNTAPAMAVIASLKAKEKKSILIFCPSDHYIENVEDTCSH